MKFKDKALWDSLVATNGNSPFGQAIISYVETFSDLVEKDLANGVNFVQAAENNRAKADKHYISAAMYNTAIQALCSVWEYGEELRQWHNLRSQINHEGVRANETGRILNTSIITTK